MDLTQHSEAILQRALANGGDFAEIFFEERTHTSIRVEESQVQRVVSGTDVGAGIRLIEGDRVLYAHTNDTSLDGLLRTADVVAGSATAHSEEKPCFEFHPESFSIPVAQSAQAVSSREKVRLTVEADKVARSADPRVAQVTVRYTDSLRRIVVVNSLGRFVEDVRPQLVFMVQAVARENGVIQTGMRFAGGTQGFELFEQDAPETLARDAARKACMMLSAEPAPTGRMPVVLSSAAGGTMVHEAVGHGLEADAIDKGRSKYCGRLGEAVAPPYVTVVDDGALAGRRGSGNVDDEGTPTARTVLIDRGVLVRFMNDLRTARKMGHAPSGNGRRESYQSRPIPRMTNTMITPGTGDPEAILSETQTGLYVRQMGGGQVNPLNGDFVFGVSEAYLIENGRAERPVRDATLIGNGPQALMDIEAVGSDLGFALGTCGKEGQGVPVSDAQPTLRIRELTVGGTQG